MTTVKAEKSVVYALKMVIVTKFVVTIAKLALQMITSLVFAVSKLIRDVLIFIYQIFEFLAFFCSDFAENTFYTRY